MIKREMLKFENRSDIIRDPVSKAIINTDYSAYMSAKRKKNESQRINKMEKDVEDLKTMMKILINKLDTKDEDK
jgi:hypothetical protein